MHKIFVQLLLVFLLIGAELMAQPIVIENFTEGAWQTKEAPVQLKLVQSYGKEFPDQGVAFSTAGKIVGVQTDLENNVYVLDNQRNMLVKFSEDGSVIWRIDQEGRGPGDLENPLGLAVNEQYIFVSNLFGSRLDVFNLGGQFVESVQLQSPSVRTFHLVGILKKKYLVLKNVVYGKAGIQLTVLDTENDFQTVSQFNAFEETDIEIPEGAQIGRDATVVGEHITVAGAMTYTFEYYDISGSIKKIVKRKFPAFVRPGIAQNSTRGYALQLGGLSSFMPVAGRLLTSNIVWPKNIDNPDEAAALALEGEFKPLEQKNSLDFYSREGKLLYSMEESGARPEIGRIKHTDQQGYLYTAQSKPFPMVNKYKVIVEQ